MDVEVIFFLVAAIIAALSKLHERSKAVRAKSLEQQRKREGRERLDLVRVGTEVVEAPPLPPPVKAVPVRPQRQPPARPPRRTRRAVPAAKPAVVHHAPGVDLHFVTRLRRNPKALREAIMLREILGPPVAMRGFRFPRR